MNATDRGIVESVKSAVDIVEVAQGYFPLTRAGNAFKALCPFHAEKTPSFHVIPAKQIFHCFGCLKSGDVFNLVMALDRLTFPEALAQLASRAGIRLPARRGEASAEEEQRTRLFALVRQACEHFQRHLRGAQGAQAREYLAKRGLTAETIAAFQIGYAPPEWRDLVQHLRGLRFADADLLRSGLVRRSEKSGEPYDLLRNRIVIPIKDSRGRVIAFGGRVLDHSEPKYLNTPETELFSKRSVLFGFERARDAAAKQGGFVIVEGYMDVIAAHAKGATQVVGTLGTALSREHASIMRRYSTQTTLLFDADQGGVRASDRGGPLLLDEGFDVRVATLEPGQDPDDYFKDHDSAQFRAWLDARSEELVGYLVRRGKEKARGGGDAALAATAREILGQFGRVRDAVHRDLLIRKVGDAFGLDETLARQVAAEAARAVPPERAAGSGESPEMPIELKTPATAREVDEAYVLQVALTDANLAATVIDALADADFQPAGRRRLFSAMREQMREGGGLTAAEIGERLKEDGHALAHLHQALAFAAPHGESLAGALDRMRERRKEHEYRLSREESRRSGSLSSDVDEELNAHLRRFAEFNSRRTQRPEARADIRSNQDRPRESSGDIL